jgi:hypothetical protein
MEDLFKEILAASPTTPTASLPPCAGVSHFEIPVSTETTDPASVPEMNLDEALGALSESMSNAGGVNWANKADMKRILDMLPNTVEGDGYPDTSELDLGWEPESFANLVGMVDVL